MEAQNLRPFHLTDDNPQITEADGTADVFSDLWKYQVPGGTEVVVEPGDTFFAYLEDTSPAEVGDSTARIEIVVRDPAEQDNDTIYGPALYLRSKEKQDRQKMAKIRRSITVPGDHFIVIRARDDGTIDASDSYFELNVHQRRATIYS